MSTSTNESTSTSRGTGMTTGQQWRVVERYEVRSNGDTAFTLLVERDGVRREIVVSGAGYFQHAPGDTIVLPRWHA